MNTMSGEQLVDTLKGLDFPGVESLEPQALDWMFEHDAVAPFLEWLCQNVSRSNMLEKKKLQELVSFCFSFIKL